MTAKELLDAKRQGKELASEDIREFVEGFTAGLVPDYQASAFAMAVCCRGMNARETADLTEAMMRSGRVLDWGEGLPVADKHSTGGVGDKLSLIIQPLAAACGLRVPSLSGRALGHTGGTIDKLESIPGYNATLSLERFTQTVNAAGLSITAQTAEICPADKKLYALRDVTGTVASIPLITASILSKKLAEGAGTLVFDVKCGAGAFMKTLDEARELARSLVDSAKAAGRKATALITDMSAPLGRTSGNANEVAESLDILENPFTDRLLEAETELSLELASHMVTLALGMPLEDSRRTVREKILDRSALAKFREMCTAQGGDVDAFRSRYSSAPVHRFRVSAMRGGYVSQIDPLKIASAGLELGAGRKVESDRLDHSAGICLDVAVGDRIAAGAPLATLSTAERPDRLEPAAATVLEAISLSSTQPETRGLLIEEIV